MGAEDYRGFRAGSKPQRLAEEFEGVLRDASLHGWNEQLNCADRPELYVDFVQAPTAERGAWLCAGCPLQALCRDTARATKPGWGVWGGEVWVRGKRVRDTPTEN